MKPEKPKKLGFKKIYLNLDKILFLFFLIFMLVDYIWLPLNSLIAGFLLSQTGYLFISYNNVFEILKHAPLVSFGFLILIAINLLVAYFQLSLLFIGARHLLYHEKLTLIEYSRKVFQQSCLFMKRFSFFKMAFVFFYVAMLFPFIRKILKIYYLNKIIIPDFIVTYLEDKYWLVGLLILSSAWILLYISVRLMFALPKILFEKKTVREGVKYSLQKTKKHVIFYAWNLLLIIIKTYLFFFLLLIPILFAQVVMDE